MTRKLHDGRFNFIFVADDKNLRFITVYERGMTIQWKPLNVITLGHIQSDSIN